MHKYGIAIFLSSYVVEGTVFKGTVQRNGFVRYYVHSLGCH
jgi:hypothetical protein